MGPKPGRVMTSIHVGTVALIAVVFRIPVWAAQRHLTFDEGVFLASTDLANAGFLPYRDFFMSQGPAFMPSLQFAQWISGGDSRGARTAMVVAAVLVSISLYFILRHFTSASRAFVYGVLASASGTVLLAAGPVQSDGLALGLSLAALAVALKEPTGWRTVLVGVLLGAAVATKSLPVLPVVLAVLVVFAAKRRLDQLVITSLVAAAFFGVVAIPYGLGNVWDQYVLFHLAKDNTPDLLANIGATGRLVFNYDLPILILTVGAIVTRFGTSSRQPPTYEQVPRWLPMAWLAATLLVLIPFARIDGGFARTVSFMIPPLLVVLASAVRWPTRWLFWIAPFAVAFQLLTVHIVPAIDPVEELRIAHLEEDVAADRYVVTDEPGLMWAAGRISHPTTVDPSFARLATGYLTTQEIELALADEETCAYLPVSNRFDSVPVRVPDSYGTPDESGLYLRNSC